LQYSTQSILQSKHLFNDMFPKSKLIFISHSSSPALIPSPHLVLHYSFCKYQPFIWSHSIHPPLKQVIH